MITGKLYLITSNKSIRDKIKYLIDTYGVVKDHILYVLINIKYAESENLKNDDVVYGMKIKLSSDVMENYFWFIVENKDEKYQNLIKIKEISENVENSSS